MDKKYKAYGLGNYRNIPQISNLSKEDLQAIEVVGRVLPFKANNYVVDELIDWNHIDTDPIYTLIFPRREMLIDKHYQAVNQLLEKGAEKSELTQTVNLIRSQLNPHPAGQEHNVPILDGVRLQGMQHKYHETVLFFPTQGQTCHAYCTFCFRWPQFFGGDELKFAMKEADLLLKYLSQNPQVTDVLFTGGDPMTMSAALLATYIEPLLQPEMEHIRTIRIGSKSLAYWPYRYTTATDADDILRLFDKVAAAGKSIAFQAHFNHPIELSTPVVQEAIQRIRNTGAQIRTQSPLLKHINDSPDIWSDMWRKQVNLGCIPYYMFVARDTGSKHYFELPLDRCWEIFRGAYSQVSGICRTVRGPSMSDGPGKIQILGVTELRGEKVFTLSFIQGRNPEWINRPFFAAYDAKATWFDQLQPAFGEDRFFFEREYSNHAASK